MFTIIQNYAIFSTNINLIFAGPAICGRVPLFVTEKTKRSMVEYKRQ